MIDPKRHSGPLPLIVGVTGHRDIADDDVAAVREMIGKVLASLRESFPWSEIQLLTALAEGADQLAAEVAVSLGVPLIAVSPMPLAAYEATFAADAGRKTLRRLWSAALTRMELPPVADAPGGMLEKLQYEQAGLVISRTSHVLLALWNGLEAWEPGASEAERLKMQGGTAHIVYLRAAGEQNSQVFRQSRIFPERAGLFDFGGNGPTLRVAAARQTVPGRAGARVRSGSCAPPRQRRKLRLIRSPPSGPALTRAMTPADMGNGRRRWRGSTPRTGSCRNTPGDAKMNWSGRRLLSCHLRQGRRWGISSRPWR